MSVHANPQAPPLWSARRAGLVVALLLALVVPAVAKKAKPAPCAPGTFALAGTVDVTVSSAVGEPVSALDFTGSAVHLGSCLLAARVRATRRSTRITGRAARCGPLRRVRLVARITAPACDVARWHLSARHHRGITFAASRVTTPTTIPTTSTTTTTTTTISTTTSTTRADTTRGLIEQALDDGRIDLPTSLVYRVWAVFLDGQLPPEYDGPDLGGEDPELFFEIQALWDTLPATARAAIQPYLLRPTDPGSPFSATAGVRPRDAGTTTPPTPCAAWTSATASVAWAKVWVCQENAVEDQAILSTVLGVLDRHWQEMVFDMGEPRHDDGTGGDDRIDVYVVDGGTCVTRGGRCQAIPVSPGSDEPAYAVAQIAPPAAGSPGGSSGYLLVRRDRALGDPVKFESDVVHELYHVMQDAHIKSPLRIVNLSAGGFAVDSSWFVEASAKWAEWAYVPASSPTEVNIWYPAHYNDTTRAFVTRRYQPGDLSLLLAGASEHQYASYIWPYFMQQELGGPEKVGAAWKAADFATGPEAIDRAVDAQLPFAKHFGDFAVRNLNYQWAGDPLQKHFWDLDPKFPHGAHPVVYRTDLYPPVPLTNGTLRLPLDFAVFNLATQYFNFQVPTTSGIQHVLFELDPDEPGTLDLEAVAELVSDDTWKRFTSSDGRRLEFCLKDPQQNVDDIILAIGNHSFTRSSNSINPPQTKGTMYVTADGNCGEWSGSITYRFANLHREETQSELGTAVDQAHEIVTQSWSPTEAHPDPTLPVFQQVTMSWVGTDEVNDTYDLSPAVACGMNTLHSSRTGTKSLAGTVKYDVFPEGPNGAIGFGPTPGLTPPPVLSVDWLPHFDSVTCDGQEITSDGPTRTLAETLLVAVSLYGPPGGFTPDPADPTHYHGSNVVTVAPDVTVTLTWDLHHFAGAS